MKHNHLNRPIQNSVADLENARYSEIYVKQILHFFSMIAECLTFTE